MKQTGWVIFSLFIGFGLGLFAEGQRKRYSYINRSCLNESAKDLRLKFETASGIHTLVCANGVTGEGCILDSVAKPNQK